MIWVLLIIGLILLFIIMVFSKIRVDAGCVLNSTNRKIQFSISAFLGLVRIHREIELNKKDGTREPAEQGESKAQSQKDISNLWKRVPFEEAGSIIKKFLSRSSVNRLSWHSKIGTGDAAHTSVLSGAAYGIKSTVIGVLLKYIPFQNPPAYSVEPLYHYKAVNTEISCIVEFRIVHAIFAGTMLVKSIGTRNLIFKQESSIPQN
ncbi:DUF2953 domain-containing protein [Peribacillus kribbensis]|uniref:DUF2953 domain-containing protein n=1 Tax=Peribacillus kribbensis TaxID=356658 RepID=UPI0003F6825E|nr:DUF2953 domain-containing protein [Peribacillus kribbensis]